MSAVNLETLRGRDVLGLLIEEDEEKKNNSVADGKDVVTPSPALCSSLNAGQQRCEKTSSHYHNEVEAIHGTSLVHEEEICYRQTDDGFVCGTSESKEHVGDIQLPNGCHSGTPYCHDEHDGCGDDVDGSTAIFDGKRYEEDAANSESRRVDRLSIIELLKGSAEIADQEGPEDDLSRQTGYC